VAARMAPTYAPLPLFEYALLCCALSLGQYLQAPRHQSMLSRALLPLLPRALTAASSSSSGDGSGGLLLALSEVHRMFLLVDGR
jgi:hypothetical protein